MHAYNAYRTQRDAATPRIDLIITAFRKVLEWLDEADAKRNGAAVNPAYRLRLGTALASSGDRANARREVETSLANESSLSKKEAQEARNLLATF